MNYDGLEDKLRQLRNEDYIWIIYIGIIILSWYSNSLERKYFIYNDEVSKERYRKIIILIFSILVIIYLYFFKDSLNDLRNVDFCKNSKKGKLSVLSSISSLLILISGLIFLYIAIVDEDIDVELAFN